MEIDNLFFSVIEQETSSQLEFQENNLAIARRLYDGLFAEQQQVLDDPYKYKSALCPRRSGKSWLVLTYAFIVALEHPDANIPIVTLTLKSARNIYWKMAKEFIKDYGIGTVSVHNSELRITLSNNSTIFFIGAESRAEIEKLRGGAYNAAFVDECKSYAPAILSELLFEVLDNALSDRDGTLMIIGTPGSIMQGPFFEATYPDYVKQIDDELSELSQIRTCRSYTEPHPYWEEAEHEPMWSFHHWHSKHNIFAPKVWQRALLAKSRFQYADDNPIWLREYLGQWAQAEDTFVYAYANLFNQYDEETGLSKVHWKPVYGEGYNQHGLSDKVEWRYLLGMDLGYEDDTAIVVVAYSPELQTMYQLDEYKSPHMIIDDVALKIDEFFQIYGKFDAMVADMGAGGKQLVESINQRYGLYIERAEKQHKFDYIELLNSDMHRGMVKILPRGDLALEMQGLQFDTSKGALRQLAKLGKLREDPAAPNHLCDAFLYIWRYSYHFFGRAKKEQLVPGTPAWVKEWEDKEIAKYVKLRDRHSKLTELEALQTESLDPFKMFTEDSWKN